MISSLSVMSVHSHRDQHKEFSKQIAPRLDGGQYHIFKPILETADILMAAARKDGLEVIDIDHADILRPAGGLQSDIFWHGSAEATKHFVGFSIAENVADVDSGELWNTVDGDHADRLMAKGEIFWNVAHSVKFPLYGLMNVADVRFQVSGSFSFASLAKR